MRSTRQDTTVCRTRLSGSSLSLEARSRATLVFARPAAARENASDTAPARSAGEMARDCIALACLRSILLDWIGEGRKEEVFCCVVFHGRKIGGGEGDGRGGRVVVQGMNRYQPDSGDRQPGSHRRR